MRNYAFPIITLILLMLFFLGIPDLSKADIKGGRHRIGRIDFVIMAAITVIFAFVDFTGLGNTKSPETFVNVTENNPFLTVSEDTQINKIVFYTGVGSGQYMIDFSSDGTEWENAASFSQDSASVLKWKTIIPIYTISDVKYIRIYASGNVFLGEVALIDSDDNIIPYESNIYEISDEQDCVQLTETHLNSSYFDEIYHARTAWEHMNGVYPYEISHPPLGKIIISAGIALFGMTPFGWRFSGTLFGVLMLPLIYVFTKKMFGSIRVSICSTLVLATDFMHFVQTRIATIDTYAVFFILLMYIFMYEYVTEGHLRSLALSGLFFGIGAACKWTCIYAGAGLALIWFIYWLINIRDNGWVAFVKNALFCIVFFIIVPCTVYYLSYIPYAGPQNIVPVFSAQYLDMVLDNQKFMFSYHSSLVAEHPYSSVWYQWIFDIRPILYYLRYNADGTRQSFGAFVNPFLCWGGLIALFVLAYYSFFKKEKTALFILIGYFAQLVPWMFVTRLTFEYHYFPCTVFLVLALGYVFRIMENGIKRYRLYIYSFTAVSAALFIMFYPVLSGVPIKESVQHALLSWLPSWPF